MVRMYLTLLQTQKHKDVHSKVNDAIQNNNMKRMCRGKLKTVTLLSHKHQSESIAYLQVMYIGQ